MRYQQFPYSCGAAAVVNALRALGRKVPERTIRRLAATTKADGTQDHGIKQCLERLGYRYDEDKYAKRRPAFDAAVTAVQEGAAVIILAQAGQHWVTAIGACGSSLIIADPQRTKGNKVENGIHMWTRSKVSKLWTPYKGTFDIIIVTKS